MNNAAATTETAVRIGKGLSVHAQMKGIEGVAAMCGTVSRVFGAARRVTAAVTCEKCLAQIAADEAFYAQQEREEAMAAEETVEARLSSILAEVETTTPVVLTGTFAPAFAAGDIVRAKDGSVWTVRRINANGTVRLMNDSGQKVSRKPESLTGL